MECVASLANLFGNTIKRDSYSFILCFTLNFVNNETNNRSHYCEIHV